MHLVMMDLLVQQGLEALQVCQVYQVNLEYQDKMVRLVQWVPLEPQGLLKMVQQVLLVQEGKKEKAVYLVIMGLQVQQVQVVDQVILVNQVLGENQVYKGYLVCLGQKEV